MPTLHLNVRLFLQITPSMGMISAGIMKHGVHPYNGHCPPTCATRSDMRRVEGTAALLLTVLSQPLGYCTCCLHMHEVVGLLKHRAAVHACL